jgi:hypothetical protein
MIGLYAYFLRGRWCITQSLISLFIPAVSLFNTYLYEEKSGEAVAHKKKKKKKNAYL